MYYAGAYLAAMDKFEVALDILHDFLGTLKVAHPAIAGPLPQ